MFSVKAFCRNGLEQLRTVICDKADRYVQGIGNLCERDVIQKAILLMPKHTVRQQKLVAQIDVFELSEQVFACNQSGHGNRMPEKVVANRDNLTL